MTNTVEMVWFTGPASDPHRYRVTDPEGIAGGEALVFQARHRDGRLVALKQITEAGREQRGRLLDRAKVLKDLHHPDVVEQVDAFLGPGLFVGAAPPSEDFDLLYLVAAWVDGTTLATLGAVEAPERALDLLEHIAAGVDHLHAHGIVHRDLHPGNVVVAGDRAVVIDLTHVRTAAPATTSIVFGVVGFVPPERLDDPGSADEGADRWQVAMLAVQLLLGRPRRRQSLTELRKELADALSDAVADPQAGADRIVRLLASDPAARPTTTLGRWVAEIRSAKAEPTSAAEPTVSTGRRRRRAVTRRRRRSSKLLVGLGAASSAAVLTAALLLSQDVDPSPQPAAAPPISDDHTAGCPIAIGQSDPRIPLPESRYQEIAQLGHGLQSCPASIVDAYGPMAVQVFDARSPVGALVSSGPGHAFALTQAQWASYRTVGAGDGSRAADVAGTILSITSTPGSDVLHTTHGELVGSSPTVLHTFRAAH